MELGHFGLKVVSRLGGEPGCPDKDDAIVETAYNEVRTATPTFFYVRAVVKLS